MVTVDAGTDTYRKFASIGVFYEAFREFGELLQLHRPVFYWIWNTRLIADRVVASCSYASVISERDRCPLFSAAFIARTQSTQAARKFPKFAFRLQTWKSPIQSRLRMA